MITLRMGVVGPEVGELHQSLLEWGYAVDLHEMDMRAFGPSTAGAVQAFQASHVGPDGLPLSIDGVVGEHTRWALAHGVVGGDYAVAGWRLPLPEECGPGVHRMLTLAAADAGRREEPPHSNRGPMIAQYGADGQPWCAAAVSYWLHELPKGCPWGLLLSAWKILEWAVRHDCSFPNVCAEPGDVFVIMREQFRGHVGLVAGPATVPGMVYTIEGNAGDAVRLLERPATTFSSVVRPW